MEKSSLMNTLNRQMLTDKKKESLFTAIYIGAIFIIIALIYYLHLSDNLWDDLIKFFTSLTIAQVPATGLSLPAPADPTVYTNLYIAAFQFSIAIGILEIVILALRVWLHSAVSRKAETIENIVFWLGASYLIITYLVRITILGEWFVFWAGIILIFGIALVARAFVLFSQKVNLFSRYF